MNTEDRFTWDHNEHASHFPKLFDNQAKRDKEAAEKKARIEQDKLYGEDDE